MLIAKAKEKYSNYFGFSNAFKDETALCPSSLNAICKTDVIYERP
jgi:hypothetical protein